MVINEQHDLTLFNSYRVNSKCKRAFFPETSEDFVSIYKNYPGKKIILGGGYNVILSKKYYEEDFILIGESFSKCEVKSDSLVAESGMDLKSLSELALANGLTGMETFFDIPSSLGGAVVMNAGASGIEIKDFLQKVAYLDLADMKLKEIQKEEMEFEYRNSFFQKNTDKIVLKTWLKLSKGNTAEIRKQMDDIKEKRWAKQPKGFPNAGSVFKRPKGFYVGTMIEELNLKGLTVGGVQISKKHAGFIVNFNGGSGEDILGLIKIVKDKVFEKFGVELEVEQRII